MNTFLKTYVQILIYLELNQGEAKKQIMSRKDGRRNTILIQAQIYKGIAIQKYDIIIS